MADADSFHEQFEENSDEQDGSARDADCEDEGPVQIELMKLTDSVKDYFLGYCGQDGRKKKKRRKNRAVDHHEQQLSTSSDSEGTVELEPAEQMAAASLPADMDGRDTSQGKVERDSCCNDNACSLMAAQGQCQEGAAAAPDRPILEAEAAAAISRQAEQINAIQKLLETAKLQGLGQPQMKGPAPKNMEDAKKKQYEFWSTQPVTKLGETVVDVNECIEADKPRDQIRQDTFTLPAGFHWDTLDINNPPILKELYTLLNENYVEDDDNMFRFDYSPEFLKWALMPPGWQKDWHAGIRVDKSKKLVGFISAMPATVRIYDKVKPMVEINFLCVHKKLRSKRVAPVLIREITRRVNLRGLFQAVYTAGVVLPSPVSSCRYWHRSLNPKKLIECKFSHLTRNMTLQRTLKLFKLPAEPKLHGLREMKKTDVPQVQQLLQNYLQQFDLAPHFSEDEVEHWFLPQPDIINSYVLEYDGKIMDFVSFYTLPSTVMHNPKYNSLKAAYSFYNVSTKTPIVDLMQDALITAKNLGFDVFNALDLMENTKFLEKLKFGVGDGNLQYYLYNWKCSNMEANKVGLVLQ